jgi:hypothetical protein
VKIMLARALAAAALVLSAYTFSATFAEAQAFPPGSYQTSCEQVHWAGTTLVAECRKHDGGKAGTGLPNALRCKGDIANNNGQLQCISGGAPPPAAVEPPARGPAPPPGYAAPPQPGYSAPGNGGYDDRRVRCEELGHREGELRDRLQYMTPGDPEREHIEYRLHETHEDRERLGCEH